MELQVFYNPEEITTIITAFIVCVTSDTDFSLGPGVVHRWQMVSVSLRRE